MNAEHQKMMYPAEKRVCDYVSRLNYGKIHENTKYIPTCNPGYFRLGGNGSKTTIKVVGAKQTKNPIHTIKVIFVMAFSL